MANRNVKFKKIRVRNFLAHRDTTLHLDENGAYHLWGENNAGKSALLNAIAILMRNISNLQYKFYLRDETSTFIIEAEMWDGSEIKLSRGATDFYEWTIDGNYGRLDKTKGNVPSIVSEYFNLYVDSEKVKHWVNLRLVRETLLFVDTTAGEQALLLQKALGTEDILMAMKEGDKEKKAHNSKVKFLSEQLEVENAELEKITNDYKIKENQVEDFDRKYDVINKDYATYIAMRNTLNEAVKILKTKKEIKEYQSVNNIEKFDSLKKEFKIYSLAKETYSSMISLGNTKKELEKEKTKVLNADNLKEIKKSIDTLNKMKSTIDILTKLEKEMIELKEQNENVQKLNNLSEQIQYEILICNKLENIIKEKEDIEKLSVSLGEAKAVYEKADSEWLDYMRENSFCPIVSKTKDKSCPFGINK